MYIVSKNRMKFRKFKEEKVMRKGFKKVLSIALCAAMMGTMWTAGGGVGKKYAGKRDNE